MTACRGSAINIGTKMNVIVNIGSNLGNTRLNLSRAMAAIVNRFGDIERSHAMDSEPWGFESPHRFLNVCIMFATDLAPAEVHEILRGIEADISPAAHRAPDGSYADRLIDIDIVAIDDMVIDTPELQVPHPRLPERDFFLKPLAEIAPGWRHPVNGMSPDEMLALLPPIQQPS